MASTQQRTTLTLDTLIVVRELFDGTELCFPVADPALVSYSPADAGLAEQRLFLEEYLPQQPPAVLARFSCPPATELRELDVLLTRKDLPKRLQLTAPTSVACLVIPHGRDSWVVVPSIGHVFYVAPAEDLDGAVRDEVQRMVAAMEPTPLEFLELLPAQSSRLEPLTLELDRSRLAGFMPAGKARALRKRAAEAKLNRDALAVLESVAIPLHTRRSVLRAAPVVGRERELEQLDALLGARERLSVLLLGDDLVGKSALLSAWLRARAGSDEPRAAYATSGAQLIAGMSGLGQWQERVRRVLEAAERLDAILYFDNLGDLFGDRPDGKVDLAGAMRRFVDDGRVRVVGELRQAAVESYERRHVGFFAGLHRIKLEPLSAAQAAEALQRRVEHAAQHEPQRPNLDPAAVQPLIDLVERYRPYQSHPGSGIALYEELRAMHEQAQRSAASRRSAPMEDKPATIGRDALLSAFSMQSGVPRFLLARDSALAVDQVEARLARRLVGQREAVRRVAEAICVVKAGLQPPGKPLSTFLFVGPTGVGKTELARSLADYLFGSERRLTRFDMSEYMDPGAAQRLIQGTDRAEGQLTQRVRQQPFCVLLLDEIEKAHPAVFDLLLQVCGEGRLTDAAGRLAHFNNALIIMTSNLGAAHRRQAIGLAAPARDDQAYYDEQVEAAFRPEFVNRIDRIIAFSALSAGEIEQIARLALRGLNRRRGVSELGLSVEPSAAAVRALARRGHSEAYGARQLRRALEQSLVTPLARLLADLGPRARGARAVVQTAAEAEADPAGSELLARVAIPAAADDKEGEHGEHEALVLTVSQHQRGAPRSSAQLRGLNDLSDLRRRVDRYMELETVSEVRDQLDFIVAQLTAGGDGRDKGKGKGKGKGEASSCRASRRIATAAGRVRSPSCRASTVGWCGCGSRCSGPVPAWRPSRSSASPPCSRMRTRRPTFRRAPPGTGSCCTTCSTCWWPGAGTATG